MAVLSLCLSAPHTLYLASDAGVGMVLTILSLCWMLPGQGPGVRPEATGKKRDFLLVGFLPDRLLINVDQQRFLSLAVAVHSSGSRISSLHFIHYSQNQPHHRNSEQSTSLLYSFFRGLEPSCTMATPG